MTILNPIKTTTPTLQSEHTPQVYGMTPIETKKRARLSLGVQARKGRFDDKRSLGRWKASDAKQQDWTLSTGVDG